eukprot:5295784-Alexandrium_andersonii.AAC.1
MSASLVGSEMCIRDSYSIAAHVQQRFKQFAAVCNGFLRSLSGGATAPPVSYTHLTLPTICSV